MNMETTAANGTISTVMPVSSALTESIMTVTPSTVGMKTTAR